jgi:hypothetical protein
MDPSSPLSSSWDDNSPLPEKQAPSPFGALSTLASAAFSHMPGAGLGQAAVSLGSDMVGQVAGNLYGVGKSIADGSFGSKQGSRDAFRTAQQAAEDMHYTPSTQQGRDIVEGIQAAPAAITGSHMGFGPLPELMSQVTRGRGVNSNDIRVLGKQGIEGVREFKNIPDDFANARQGVNRESAFGGNTMGSKLEAAATDIGDYAANRQSQGLSPIPGVPKTMVDAFGPQRMSMFEGKNSATYPHAKAAQASAMEAANEHPNDIWNKTNIMRFYDGNQLHEIPSYKATSSMNESHIDQFDLTLPDVFHFPEIYKAYPQLANITVVSDKMHNNTVGYFSPSHDAIFINENMLKPVKPTSNSEEAIAEAEAVNEQRQKKLNRFFKHETQHVIQKIEKIGGGGSEKDFPDAHEIQQAQALEQYMGKHNVSSAEAANYIEKKTGTRPSVKAIAYATLGQGSLIKETDPVQRYRLIDGEVLARLAGGDRGEQPPHILKQFNPLDRRPKNMFTNEPASSDVVEGFGRKMIRQRNYGIDVDPADMITRKGKSMGIPTFTRTQGLPNAVDIDTMKASLALGNNKSIEPVDPRASFKALVAKNNEEKALKQAEEEARGPRTLEQRMKDQAELEEMRNFKPTVEQMKAEIASGKVDVNKAVKEKGGNWVDKWVDHALSQFRAEIPKFNVSKPFTQAQGNYLRRYYPEIQDAYYTEFNESGKHGMHYGKDMWDWLAKNHPQVLDDLVKEQSVGHSLNNWVDKRLKSYIKNDMGTPTDPVRDLADQGISHIQGIEDVPAYKNIAAEHRLINKMPEEGYAKTEAGKVWEANSDSAIMSDKAKNFASDYTAAAKQQPYLLELAEKSPGTRIYRPETSLTGLGFDHLLDELRNALDPNSGLPRNLLKTPKDLERMTVPDAVRHVHKINEYRAKQMEKTAAEDMKDFPAIKTYENGNKWHELKLPAISEKAAQLLAEDPLFGIPQQVRDSWDRKIHRDLDIEGIHDTESDEFRDEYTQREQDLAQDYFRRHPNHDQEAYNKLEKALKNEGDLMGHCVGGYCPEVASGASRIFTLRDKRNRPHVTIEAVPETYTDATGEYTNKPNGKLDIAQIKGKQNAAVIDKYHEYVLDYLNSMHNLGDVNDLKNINAIDLDYLVNHPTESPNKLAVKQLRKQNPDLPRFMDVDKLKELINAQKPEGHKKGGMIHRKVTPDEMRFAISMRT